MGQPFLRTAGHARRQPGGIGGVFQSESIPAGDRPGNLPEIRCHVKEPAPVGRLVRIHSGGHHDASVARSVRTQGERVVQHQRDGREFAGQRGLPRVARVDVVHRLTQIQVQVLPRAAAPAVHRCGRDRIAHHRNADCGAQPVPGRNDRIRAGEAHSPPGVGGGQPDIGEQIVKRGSRIEFGCAELGAQRCLRHVDQDGPHDARPTNMTESDEK